MNLLPNRLCEYLKEVAVKFTDFVTKCHVLNAEDEKVMMGRLILCEATKKIMMICFELLGINVLERIWVKMSCYCMWCYYDYDDHDDDYDADYDDHDDDEPVSN